MKIKLFLFIVLIFNLTNIPKIHAQLKYSEKRNTSQQQTTSGATRGCRTNLPKMQLLAPSEQIVEIGESQIFLLNINQISPYPIKISVLEPNNPKSLWSKELRPTQSGLQKIILPTTLNLKPYQDYILTATIYCDQNNPSNNAYIRVFFRKTTPSLSITSLNSSPQQQVSSLLQQGLWYDALWVAYYHHLPQFKQILKQENIELED